ncbi:hypothetical protein DH2020_033071 [Rehmannia glutinosa]|uniref:Uncharacterized protein n=1 Tax=Rehmannia glutinosa TaxID=99300 RepID=A0ABR0VGB3_REHGL
MRSFELSDSDSQTSSSSSSGDVIASDRSGHDVSRLDPIRSIRTPVALFVELVMRAPAPDPSGVLTRLCETVGDHRSIRRRDDSSHIRYRYFIPPEYKIIIPSREDPAIASRQKKLLSYEKLVSGACRDLSTSTEFSEPASFLPGTFPESSIKTRVEWEDSLELYRGQSRHGSVSPRLDADTKSEDIVAHDLMSRKCGAYLTLSHHGGCVAGAMPKPMYKRLEREKITIEAKIKSELDPELDGNGEKVSFEGDEEEDLEVMSLGFRFKIQPRSQKMKKCSSRRNSGSSRGR